LSNGIGGIKEGTGGSLRAGCGISIYLPTKTSVFKITSQLYSPLQQYYFTEGHMDLLKAEPYA
jgi:hypothetical protein